MLPLMGSILTMRSSEWAATIIAACIVVPQLVVAALCAMGRPAIATPRAATAAARLLRRRSQSAAALFALVADPYLVLAVQMLDGISAAIFGIMFALVVADITRDTGRFNLALGIVGSAVGIGASISTTLAGYVFDHFGHATTFLGMAAVAAAGMALRLAVDAGDPARAGDQQLTGASTQPARPDRRRSGAMRSKRTIFSVGAVASMSSR